MSAQSPGSHTSARRGVKRSRAEGSGSGHRSGRTRADQVILPVQRRHCDTDLSSDDSEGDDMLPWAALRGRVRPSAATNDEEDGLPQLGSTQEFSIGPVNPHQGTHRSRWTTNRRCLPENLGGALSGSTSPVSHKPIPLVLRSQQQARRDLATTLNSMRGGVGSSGGRVGLATVGWRTLASQSPAHSTYASHPVRSTYLLASQDHEGIPQPLCSAYSNSSRAYSGGAQWLAVGDNEGRITLIDTYAQNPDSDLYQCPYTLSAPSRPSWSASSGSLFALSWRFDDKLIASSGADYSIKVWDTATGQATNTFHGSRGTARAIEWDPFGGGHLLASAGRDGALHVYDTRMGDQSCNGRSGVISVGADIADDADADHDVSQGPLLSLWSAHAPAFKGKRRSLASVQATKGVTSLLYHRNRSHGIITTGCHDARLKMWDLRFALAADVQSLRPNSRQADVHPGAPARRPLLPLSINQATDGTMAGGRVRIKPRKARKARPGSPSYVYAGQAALSGADQGIDLGASDDPLEIRPVYESPDLSTCVGSSWNARPHGLSSIVSDDSNHLTGSLGNGANLWAACTDGRVYGVPYDLLEPGLPLDVTDTSARVSTLFHPVQLGNSLYNRISLAPDGRTLAVGCNSGDVVLWDTHAQTSCVLQRYPDAASALHGHAGAHQRNCEVNSLSWCYGDRAGWKLASAGDDCIIRTWEMDRAGSPLHGSKTTLAY
ncbi:unnamed protein product [Parajaminaea phylloscopi]